MNFVGIYQDQNIKFYGIFEIWKVLAEIQTCHMMFVVAVEFPSLDIVI